MNEKRQKTHCHMPDIKIYNHMHIHEHILPHDTHEHKLSRDPLEHVTYLNTYPVAYTWKKNNSFLISFITPIYENMSSWIFVTNTYIHKYLQLD